MELILATPEQLTSLIENVLIRHEQNNAKKNEIKLFTINQVSKKLGMSHGTIKKLVETGIIKSTKSGRITEDAIDDYLKNN